MTGELRIVGVQGDVVVQWDTAELETVEKARTVFNHQKLAGYLAYAVPAIPAVQRKGAVIKEFDPEAKRIVMTPALVGG